MLKLKMYSKLTTWIESKERKACRKHLSAASTSLIASASHFTTRTVQSKQRAGKPVWYLPLYMTFCLAEEANGSLVGIRIAPPSFVGM